MCWQCAVQQWNAEWHYCSRHPPPIPSGMRGENIHKFKSGVKETKVYLLRYFTHILGSDLSSWPPACLFLCLLASESGGLAAGSRGGSGCCEVKDDNCCLSFWMAAWSPINEKNEMQGWDGRWTGSACIVVSSQLQAYSSRNPFPLSFLRYISSQLPTWIIAGCERCHLSQRSSVFFCGLVGKHSSCPPSNLQERRALVNFLAGFAPETGIRVVI